MSTWHELRYNPRLKKIYDTRIKIIKLIRQFFWSQDFLEADTPAAVRLASQEPYLNPVPVIIHDTRNTTHKMYLRTSPEYALKKLLAAGYEKIFEIGKCWRDGESFGGNHNTEFTILEWYRAPASRSAAAKAMAVKNVSAGKTGILSEIMNDTEKLFKYVGKNLAGSSRVPSPICESSERKGRLVYFSERATQICGEAHIRGGIKGGVLRYKDREIDFNCKWDRVSMKELWQKYLQVDLNNYLEADKLKKLAEDKGYKIDDNEEYENIFYKIFLNEIEPKLGLERPVFVYDYPARMCSLSRLCASDPRYAERFELYIGGLELANAFGELTDADQQKKNLEKDMALRQKLGKEIWPVDGDFIAALASLRPASADSAFVATSAQETAMARQGGIALGVDRMVLLFTGAKDLNEVMFQSVSDQIDSD